jgi:hypothetical protein
MSVVAGAILALICLTFVFWPDRKPFIQADKTRVDSLLERKDAIYDNLRDLNFEFLAGKHPEEDYNEQRRTLEDEAAGVLAEMELLESRGVHATR